MAEKTQELSREEKAVLKQVNRDIKEKDKNVVYTSFLETEKSILEQIKPIENKIADGADGAYSFSKMKYIIYDKLTASIDYLDTFPYQGKEYRPIKDTLVDKGVILLSSGIEEYGETSDLVTDIHDFLYRNFQVPEFYEQFLPYIVLFYWAYEKFPFVPYIHFIGLTGTGKTTAQEVLGSICYKPINASGAITMSPIFRTASAWRGTLLLDEFEPDGDSYKEMLSFLKSGVGNVAVLRTEGETKREVQAYIIKSPKIFTSERPINNAGLRSRMFVIQMDKNKRKVPLYRLEKFMTEAEVLRNKLLLWRLRNLSKIDLRSIEYGYPELSGFDGRVQQVITPVYFLSDDDTKKKILGFAKIQEEETKRDRLDSFEGKIFQIIASYYPTDVSLKFVADELNKDSGKRPITPERISNITRKVLQFEVEPIGHEKTRTIMSMEKPERFDDLCLYFGIPKYTPEKPSAPSADEQMEHTDIPNDADSLFPDLDEEGVPTA